MWSQFKILYNYIITSPIVVAQNIMSYYKSDSNNTKLYHWKRFFTMSHEPEIHMDTLDKISEAKIMMKTIFPYNKDSDNKEYNTIIYNQYTVSLALLQYHAKVIRHISPEFQTEKNAILSKLKDRIDEIQQNDIPYLDRKRLHILDIVSENNHNVERILLEAKSNWQNEMKIKEENHATLKNNLMVSLRDKDQELRSMNIKLEEKNQEIIHAKTILQGRESHIKDLTRTVKDNLEEIKEYQEREKTSRCQMEELLLENQRLANEETTKIRNIKDQVNTLMQENKRLKVGHETLQETLAQREDIIKDLRNTKSIIENTLKMVQGEDKTEQLLKLMYHLKLMSLQANEIQHKTVKPLDQMHTLLAKIQSTQEEIIVLNRNKASLVQGMSKLAYEDEIGKEKIHKEIMDNDEKNKENSMKLKGLEDGYKLYQESSKTTLKDITKNVTKINIAYKELTMNQIPEYTEQEKLETNIRWNNLTENAETGIEYMKKRMFAQEQIAIMKNRFNLTAKIQQDISNTGFPRSVTEQEHLNRTTEKPNTLLARSKSITEGLNTNPNVNNKVESPRVTFSHRFRAAIPGRKSNSPTPGESNINENLKDKPNASDIVD